MRLRLAVGMLGGTGRALNNAFKVSESMTNTKGEKGYWIPESQVVGIFEQKKSSMRAAAEEAIHKLEEKMPSTFKMTISGNISCHSRHGDKNSFTAFVMEFPEV